ncbi:MAG: hypothetical protein ABIP30_04170 [Ferruginibacter sp.]
MQDLIASYLFKNKKCPLPTVGTLSIVDGNAIADYGEMKIAAPAPLIQFTEKEGPVDDFVNFITAQKNTTTDEALSKLDEFCRRLRNMDVYTEMPLNDAGKFYMSSAGSLQFKQTKLRISFIPEVTAERVIHPDDSHEMLVGDKHTTTSLMSEYFSEEEISPRNRWWIWAIILFVLTVAIILFYLNDTNSNDAFGIAQSYNLS